LFKLLIILQIKKHHETSIDKGFATQDNDYLGCSSAVAEQAMW